MKRLIIAAVFLIVGAVGIMHVMASGPPVTGPADGSCPDLTGDHKVMIGDVLYVITRYYTTDASADLDSSGLVLTNDILAVLEHYMQVCTQPTPINTPFDINDAQGPVPAGYGSWQEFADDAKDRILGNGGAGGTAAGGGWINLGCSVSPDCIAPNGSTITIHSDGSAEISVSTPEPVR